MSIHHTAHFAFDFSRWCAPLRRLHLTAIATLTPPTPQPPRTPPPPPCCSLPQIYYIGGVLFNAFCTVKAPGVVGGSDMKSKFKGGMRPDEQEY